MRDISITISASAVAWYGAIVATVAAGGAVYNMWRDRARLVVSARPNFVEIGNEAAGKKICVSVANRGRRSVPLKAVALKIRNGNNLVASDSMRAQDEIGEGKSRSYFMNQPTFEEQHSFADIEYVFAIDQTGLEWKGKFTCE
jgi:hypothetical protein